MDDWLRRISEESKPSREEIFLHTYSWLKPAPLLVKSSFHASPPSSVWKSSQQNCSHSHLDFEIHSIKQFLPSDNFMKKISKIAFCSLTVTWEPIMTELWRCKPLGTFRSLHTLIGSNYGASWNEKRAIVHCAYLEITVNFYLLTARWSSNSGDRVDRRFVLGEFHPPLLSSLSAREHRSSLLPTNGVRDHCDAKKTHSFEVGQLISQQTLFVHPVSSLLIINSLNRDKLSASFAVEKTVANFLQL